jgi:hypothetical protein
MLLTAALPSFSNQGAEETSRLRVPIAANHYRFSGLVQRRLCIELNYAYVRGTRHGRQVCPQACLGSQSFA